MDDFKQDEVTNENYKVFTKCPIDQFEKLIHSICDRLCGQNPPNFADYQPIYSLNEWISVQEIAETIITNLISNSNYIKKLSEVLSPDFYKVFQDAFHARQSHLREVMSSQCGSRTHLKDFDWNLSLSLGSDKISEMREALATIQLQIGDEDVTLELNKKELEQLVQALENANKAINQLQT